MSEEARRHLGAIVALVLGAFVGLTLLPVNVTGPFGHWLGALLWRGLGIGALGFPLLGFGLGLTGFDKLPQLDMKRTAILVIGLAILVPFLVGVLTDIQPNDFDSGRLAPRLTGVVPGFLAYGVTGGVGVAGGLLVGFALLSALTIVTIAWHPLLRWVGAAPAAVEAGTGAVVPVPRAKPVKPPVEEDEDEPHDSVIEPSVPREKKKKPPRPQKPAAALIGDVADDHVLPPVDLLTPPPAQDKDAGAAELDRLGQVLLDTLRTFKVEGTIAGRTTGPVVTQFEVVPGPGVKVGRFAALADDMAITMRAQSIRVAPIPGKGAIGVEIPNPTARMVTLRELLESDEFQTTKAMLPVALGRNLEGKPIIADLAKMPHLLIAGATGSGKSVAVNTIVTSLVYKYTDKQLRFLMVDPKMVELSLYNALPHMRHPVVTQNTDAAFALKWAVYEMNRRYELLHANHARNLADFNKKAEEGEAAAEPEQGEGHPREHRGRGRHHTAPRAGRGRLQGWPAPAHRHDRRRAGRPHDDGAGGGGDAARAAGPEGARHRHPPDPRHAAPLGERHHRPHQGQLPEPDRLPRGLQGGQPHHPGPERRRGAARQRRHAVPPAGEERADAAPGRLHQHRGNRTRHRLVHRARRGADRGRRAVAGAGDGHPRRDPRPRGRRRRGRRGGRRRAARRPLPAGRRGLHPEPERLHLAAAAAALDRLWAGGAHHRPAVPGGDPRAVHAGVVEAAGSAHRDRAAGRILPVSEREPLRPNALGAPGHATTLSTGGPQGIRCSAGLGEGDVPVPAGPGVLPVREDHMGQSLIASAETSIRVPRARVWAALVDPAALREYMFGAVVTSDWTEGSPITWEGEWQGKAYRDTGEVLRVRPGEVLQYAHASPQGTGPAERHVVTIQLSDAPAGTRVALTQDNNPTEEARGHATRNWEQMLAALKQYLER
ncbi:MAG: SRPBCC domain-containing protein [Gemmatimonadetes bacterium]|nr:SRPBCC domain-containing protein [Gemmatimonadota bacterium]